MRAGWRRAARLWASLGLALSAAPALAQVGQITPAPVRAQPLAGELVIGSQAPLYAPPRDAAAARTAAILADLTARAGGPKLFVTHDDRRAGGVKLVRAPAPLGGEEAYGLAVTPGGLVVTSATDIGLFRGAMSALHLLTPPRSAGQPLRIPAQQIADAPRFAWRGLMLDSARHYQSPAFIRTLIDGMAAHKLNVLHWHLTDDQAWRLEIRKYPKLTEVGGWRVPAGQGPAADIEPSTGRPRMIGGVYTQAQVRELVAYAAARHITIVPEIDVPGHASAAIAAYPELAATDAPIRAVPADWGVYPNLFNADPATLGFLTDVLDEVVELFPSTYIHLGGDEAVKDQWKASPRVQAQIKALGLADEHALQTWFIQTLGRHLETKGRKLVGWDEILEGGLPAGATVMSWRGIDGAVAAARAGHDTVLSPAPTLYFDHRQSPGVREPPGRGRVVSLAEVYAFDPAPVSLTAEQRGHILGLQGNLWTEHVRTEARAAHMAFPRALAVAELGWSPAEGRRYEAFATRAEADVARLRRLGLAAADSAFRAEPSLPPLRRESRQLSTCSDQLTLALEDDAPIHGARAIYLTDIMNPCWRWPNAELDGVTALKVSVGQLPFNFQIGEDIRKIVSAAPRTPDGELEIRVGGCTGPPAAVLPLARAARNPGVTELQAPLDVRGSQDLCFTFARGRVDPIWAVAAVELVKDAPP